MRRALRLEEIEAVYREHGAAFERVAIAVTRDEGRGCDAVQEAFVRAVRGRRAFRHEAPLVAWLWRIVLNEARRQRSSSVVEEVLTESLEAPAGSTESSTIAFVRARIADLPERQRLALFLRYYADLDYESIAHALDVKAGTVAATLHAAHRRLEVELQEVNEWTS